MCILALVGMVFPQDMIAEKFRIQCVTLFCHAVRRLWVIGFSTTCDQTCDRTHLTQTQVLLSKFPFRFYLSAVLDSVCENQKRDFEWWHKCRGNWGLFDDHLICSTTWETTLVCFRLYSQAYQFTEHFLATWLRFIWF